MRMIVRKKQASFSVSGIFKPGIAGPDFFDRSPIQANRTTIFKFIHDLLFPDGAWFQTHRAFASVII
jgi:hypothetical protein